MAKDKPLPQLSTRGDREAELRRSRQAEALRANLSRRKAQTRIRAEDEEAGQPALAAAPPPVED